MSRHLRRAAVAEFRREASRAGLVRFLVASDGASLVPQTNSPSKVERITAADIPFLSADERRKWAERAIKEGKVFGYVSGQWP